jgi:hypothetical protein
MKFPYKRGNFILKTADYSVFNTVNTRNPANSIIVNLAYKDTLILPYLYI